MIARPPNFPQTLRLLLGAARMRANGRRTRQAQILQNRSASRTTTLGGLATFASIAIIAVLNILAAVVLNMAVQTGQRFDVQRQGKVVVSQYFIDSLGNANKADILEYSAREAKRIASEDGGQQSVIQQQLRRAVDQHRDFVSEDVTAPGLSDLPNSGRSAALFGSLVLVWWLVMLTLQGEGLELDTTRRRHPMWEWLFSHPVPPSAVFLAEMLSPIAANPIYWSAPIFVGLSFGYAYDISIGFLATLLIGLPVSIAAACFGKALEIGIVLRFSPRTRGAVIGLTNWLGYASFFLFFPAISYIKQALTALKALLSPLAFIPWPWLRLFLGGRTDGSFSFLLALLTDWLAVILVLVGSVFFAVWASQKGLSGNLSRRDSRPTSTSRRKTQFGRRPLYRKELFWFIRDRSAIVQVVLIPLTMVAFQVFNMRSLLTQAQGAWNFLCGAAIFFGTYFLLILGPKSLASEGEALWIALTWPTGLESLLKAKANLWSLVSSGLVALILFYAIYSFPADSWKILLLGVGWFFFSRSMAEKSVTLVTVTSSSGEVEKPSKARQWGVMLGTLTFSIGVLTQQWQIAIMGIVYSYITAAALWQNFRAHLPYLYDPWSEKLPSPPTLMHAMISISILVEGGAIATGAALFFAGRDNIAVWQALSYAICAVFVTIGVANFLSERGVSYKEVWCWLDTSSKHGQLILGIFLGCAGGVLIGLFARAYSSLLAHLPATQELLRESQEQMSKIPNLRLSYAVAAVLFAPFAEEYLFRGLLFRALDREWGGWRAVIGSAAFFAVYHSPLAWLPVAMVGAANALLFKRTRYLLPAVILHAVYNAIVV